MNPEHYGKIREESIGYRSGAIDVAFSELGGIINKSELASQYFGKSQAWLSQKLHGCMVCNKAQQFSESEARELAAAFRDLAYRLTMFAEEIEEAAGTD